MRKIFLVVLILFLAATAQAQSGVTTTVNVSDPSNIVFFTPTALSVFNTQQNYLVPIAPNMTALMLSVSGTINNDTIQFQATCTPDASATTASFSNGVGMTFSHTSGSTFAPTMLFANGVDNLQLVGSNPPSEPDLVIINVTGCAQALLSFSNPSGTLTDTIKGTGRLSNSPLIPYSSGYSLSIAAGMDNLNARVVLISLSQNGNLFGATAQKTPTDGVSNTNTQNCLQVDQLTFPTCLQTGIYPYRFNGSTWDREFYCSNTSTFSVASTVTQVVPAVAGQKIRICSYSIDPSTSTAGTTDIVYGTGTNCGTGTTTLTGAYTLAAAAPAEVTVVAGLGSSGALTAPASAAVCVRAVTSTVNGFITWSQF